MNFYIYDKNFDTLDFIKSYLEHEAYKKDKVVEPDTTIKKQVDYYIAQLSHLSPILMLIAPSTTIL